MKTTKKQFKYFVKRFKFYQDKFELNNWKMYFKHDSIVDKTHASLAVKGSHYVATAFFTRDWTDSLTKPNNKLIDKIAKHEAIHLLLARFSFYAHERIISESDLCEAEEELSRKLDYIIT